MDLQFYGSTMQKMIKNLTYLSDHSFDGASIIDYDYTWYYIPGKEVVKISPTHCLQHLFTSVIPINEICDLLHAGYKLCSWSPLSLGTT